MKAENPFDTKLA